MKKAPEGRGLPHFLAGSVCANQAAVVRAFLLHDLLFRAEPVVLARGRLPVRLPRRFAARGGGSRVRVLVGRWLRSLVISSGDFRSWGILLRGERTPERGFGQLPKIGAVKCLFSVEGHKPPLVGGGF